MATNTQAPRGTSSPSPAGPDSGEELAGGDGGLLHLSCPGGARTGTGPQARHWSGWPLAEKEHAQLWAAIACANWGSRNRFTGADTDGDAKTVSKPALAVTILPWRRLEIEESRDIAKYSQQLKALGDTPSLSILNRVIEDEQDHYRELSGLIRRQKPRGSAGAPVADPKTLLDQLLAKRNQGRAHTAGWIGDAIYGVNDGLGSIFGICLRRFRRDPGQQQVGVAFRHRRHDRQRALHGVGRLPRVQERARDLRGGTRPRTRGHRHERRGSPRAVVAVLPGVKRIA